MNQAFTAVYCLFHLRQFWSNQSTGTFIPGLISLRKLFLKAINKATGIPLMILLPVIIYTCTRSSLLTFYIPVIAKRRMTLSNWLLATDVKIFIYYNFYAETNDTGRR